MQVYLIYKVKYVYFQKVVYTWFENNNSPNELHFLHKNITDENTYRTLF